jgi:hypothetical protein
MKENLLLDPTGSSFHVLVSHVLNRLEGGSRSSVETSTIPLRVIEMMMTSILHSLLKGRLREGHANIRLPENLMPLLPRSYEKTSSAKRLVIES